MPCNMFPEYGQQPMQSVAILLQCQAFVTIKQNHG